MRRQASFVFDGYRVYLPQGASYGYISFIRRSIDLRKVNTEACGCASCGRQLRPHDGVQHDQYGRQGYICLPCARGIILEEGARGYKENILMNLQACYDGNGRYSSNQVACAIQPADPIVVEYRPARKMKAAWKA